MNPWLKGRREGRRTRAGGRQRSLAGATCKVRLTRSAAGKRRVNITRTGTIPAEVADGPRTWRKGVLRYFEEKYKLSLLSPWWDAYAYSGEREWPVKVAVPKETRLGFRDLPAIVEAIDGLFPQPPTAPEQ
jgi:hypothetical protein